MRKGFTLIELLAVIVVLAIISVIAIPTLIGVIDKARLSALKSSAYGLIEAGNLYNAQYANSNNVRFDINNNIVTTTEENKLKYKGNVKQGTVIVSNKGQITVCITDGKNSAYKNYNDTEVTTVSKKTCSIPASTYIVYLDGQATRTELSNQELTDKITELEEKINKLKPSVDDIYPVGSYYISENESNPHDLFGGTWEKIEGRILLGSSENYALGSTGGNSSVSYTPQGTVGNHILNESQLPFIQAKFDVRRAGSNDTTSIVGTDGNVTNQHGHVYESQGIAWNYTMSPLNQNKKASDVVDIYFGGNQPHNHPFTGTQTNINVMNPYKVVNIWKRTA